MSKNYVSVTAGVSKEEVESVVQEFSHAGFTLESVHVPAIGFLVSQKTVHFQSTQPKNRRFPKFNELPELLEVARRYVLPTVHYNPHNDQRGREEMLSEQVTSVMSSLSGLCNVIQLNGKGWHEPSEIEKIKERYNDLSIILQVSSYATEGLSNQAIADKIGLYKQTIDYVLLDPSRGRGLMLNVDYAASLYTAVKSLPYEYAVVVAGGLSGENSETVVSALVKKLKTTNFSIDAEGNLRDKQNDRFFGNDILNMEKVRAYLCGVAKGLISYREVCKNHF